MILQFRYSLSIFNFNLLKCDFDGENVIFPVFRFARAQVIFQIFLSSIWNVISMFWLHARKGWKAWKIKAFSLSSPGIFLCVKSRLKKERRWWRENIFPWPFFLLVKNRRWDPTIYQARFYPVFFMSYKRDNHRLSSTQSVH